MNREFDSLEDQLGHLRPARLPVPARQRILREMERPAARHGAAIWLLGHRPVFQLALAGALSLAVVVGLHRLPRLPRPASPVDPPALASSNALLPSLAFLQAKLAVASPIGVNTVPALCSQSILTNTQIQR